MLYCKAFLLLFIIIIISPPVFSEQKLISQTLILADS